MLYKTPAILPLLYPSLTWSKFTSEKEVYLTFDDGPIPEVTPWVLDILEQYHAKATFFCIGDNARKYPELVKEILKRGHSIGNHTYNHLNGWQTPTDLYIENTEKAEAFLPLNQEKPLFRPPYGRISPAQINVLKKRYEIIMWSVLTRDYNQKVTADECFHRSLKAVKPGSIVVFHDSEKAKKNLYAVLPKFIEALLSSNYKLINL